MRNGYSNLLEGTRTNDPERIHQHFSFSCSAGTIRRARARQHSCLSGKFQNPAIFPDSMHFLTPLYVSPCENMFHRVE
jgi:hypothetical protein